MYAKRSDRDPAPMGMPSMAPTVKGCPVCEMEVRHERGCPYEGLRMDEAWKRHEWREDGLQLGGVAAPHVPPAPSDQVSDSSPDSTNEAES